MLTDPEKQNRIGHLECLAKNNLEAPSENYWEDPKPHHGSPKTTALNALPLEWGDKNTCATEKSAKQTTVYVSLF
eukprot:4479971-Amphidinium_carterae.1